jgi:hypothetical protein
MDPSELFVDLRRAGEAISPLTRSEERFRAAFDAFRAQDAESFQRLLRELELLDRCELICSWLRSKECVLVCLEVAGPPPEEIPDLRQFAEVVVRVTSDEELVERLAGSVSERDAEAFGALIRDLHAERFAHLLCHWVCGIRGRLVCRIVCGPPMPRHPHLVEELTAAGQALRQLLAKPEALARAAEAAQRGECEVLRGVLQEAGLIEFCEIICWWICSWRCIWLCLRFCRPFLAEKPDTSLTEAFEFAKVTARLAAEPATLERLAKAVAAQDAQAFEAIVKEFRLERFCIQLCHWVCFRWCRLFCICVCPPVSDAYFIRIGGYDYHTAINSAVGGNGLTIGDNRAFYDTLRLNGNISDLLSGPQIEYRFETQSTDATGTPTGSWTPVAPGQIGRTLIGWFDPGSFPFTGYVVNGAAGPHEVVATISVDGWIQVPPLFSIRGQFLPSGDLAEFASNSVAPGLPAQDETGVQAGAAAAHPLATDLYFGIRMRVRQIGNPATEHDGGTCPHIAIDNTLYDNVNHHPDWDGGSQSGQLAVAMVDILELRGNGCADLSDSLTVLFTATHPNLDPAGVAITLTGPGGPYAFSLPVIPETGDWYGAAAPSGGWTLGSLQDCAYIVTLSVNVLLTNGDSAPSPLYDQIAFCKTS